MQKTNKLNIHGLLVLDKPIGPSSNMVMQEVKRIFQAKKIGHTGSLDPLASGMLPLCFGEATKWSQYLLEADKCYQATGRLGTQTTTSDAEGEVIAAVQDFSISKSQLVAVMNQFLGTTEQIPSMYSALKHQGQPLYQLARKGRTIERNPRTIHIKHIQLLDFNGKEFTLEVICSKGTYIRNLIEDIGARLSVYAHVIALRRKYTAGLDKEKMVTLEELRGKDQAALNALLLPVDRPIDYLPKLFLDPLQIQALQQGKTIQWDASLLPGIVRIYEQGLHFRGLAEIDEAMILKVKRLVAFEA